ncbi:MAG: hypothetical protein RLZZ453_859, partial [Chlamydiota bacterium]
KETAVKETAVKETAVKETAVKETAVKETAVKETAVKETAVKETAQKKPSEEEAQAIIQALLPKGFRLREGTEETTISAFVSTFFCDSDDSDDKPQTL